MSNKLGFELGPLLREKRAERGLSMMEMSRRTGIDKAILSRVENGYDAPSRKLIEAYAKQLRLDRERLLLRIGIVPEDVLQVLIAKPDSLERIRQSVGGSINSL